MEAEGRGPNPGCVYSQNSLKWMSTKEPGAKAKKRDDEDSSAGPSHVQLLSPPGGSASARKRKLKSAAAPAHDTGTGKSSGSRTELCGILSGLLGRFRLKSVRRLAPPSLTTGRCRDSLRSLSNCAV